MKFRSILLLVFLLPLACDVEPGVGTSKGAAYLEEVLDIMEKNSVNRNTINWEAFRNTARSAVINPVNIEDVDPAVLYSLQALGDHHSSFQRGTMTLSAYDLYSVCTGSSTTPTADQMPNIGYVKVTGFSGTGSQADNFSAAIRTSIIAQDKADLTGWIVDLRGNTGGNMWPMISGVGPILGEGTAGHFIDPDNVAIPWSYSNGSSAIAGKTMHTATIQYTLKQQNPKVAVLVDARTASSGEATLISFMGRPNTRIFGVGSCGLSTSNQGFVLSDGATLTLTTSTLADRNKVKQGGSVAPDVTVTGDQDVVAKAVEWLQIK